VEINYTKQFQKAYSKLSETERLRVDKALTLFMEDRTNPAIRNHALKGRLEGRLSFSAAWDLRVIYREEGGFLTIILLNVGSHNQVY